jgi:ankyrin repeat protein
MMYCSSIGDIKRLKELLEYGGDINLQDSDGVTPLMYSLEKNNIEITKLLITYKPDLSLKTKKGNTVIDIGKKLNNESSKILLESIN